MASSEFGARVLLRLNRLRRPFVIACQKNRPAHVWDGLAGGLEKGATEVLQHRPSGVTAWAFRDRSATLLLLTNGVSDWGSLPGRRPRHQGDIHRPRVCDVYQDSMAQADKYAQMITNFRFSRRQKKWTDAVRHYTLDMVATNAYILWNLLRKQRGQAAVTHIGFLSQLVSELCEEITGACP